MANSFNLINLLEASNFEGNILGFFVSLLNLFPSPAKRNSQFGQTKETLRQEKRCQQAGEKVSGTFFFLAGTPARPNGSF